MSINIYDRKDMRGGMFVRRICAQISQDIGKTELCSVLQI